MYTVLNNVQYQRVKTNRHLYRKHLENLESGAQNKNIGMIDDYD